MRYFVCKKCGLSLPITYSKVILVKTNKGNLKVRICNNCFDKLVNKKRR